MKIETLAVHAGHAVDPASGALAPPIVLATNFERAGDGAFPHGFIYSRADNPNRQALERALATLEGGAVAAAFASGSAASMSIFQALSPGDHVVATAGFYGTGKLLQDVFLRWGLEASLVDTSDIANVEAAIRPNTRLVWVETPANPQLKVTDIEKVAKLAHAAGALCACDNTVATPVLQRPLDLGADLVMHSTTKYLGGHSDVLGGAVVSKADDEFFQRLKLLQAAGGAVPSPFECWLVVRGIRTLPYRVRAHSANALAVARFLEGQARVERVLYPGLDKNPGHAVASRQMALYGGLLSILVRGGRPEALAVAARVRLFTRATSLGGTESLIEHRASVEAPGSGTPENLLRLSIGLEHPDDLIADLAQALA